MPLNAQMEYDKLHRYGGGKGAKNNGTLIVRCCARHVSEVVVFFRNSDRYCR